MLSVVPQAQANPSAAPAIAARIKAAMVEMSHVLIERDEQIALMWACLIAKHHMVQVGGPGSAKSLLTNEMVRRIGPASDGTPVVHFFSSLHPLMKEEEIFGGTDFHALKNDGVYQHHVDRMMPEADICTLDEVFNASGSILKTMLRILNERQYKNGPTMLNTPLMSCFGTANQLPTDPTLQALWDRFLGRIETLDLSEAGRVEFQKRRASRRASLQAAPAVVIPLDDIVALQTLVPSVVIGPAMDEVLLKIWSGLNQQGISLSTRRMTWCEELLAAHALLEGRMEVTEEDLPVLEHVLWNRLQERDAVRRLISTCVSPLVAQIRDIADDLATTYASWQDVVSSTKTATDKTNQAVEAQSKYKAVLDECKRILAEARGSGSGVKQVERIYSVIRDQYTEITAAIVSNPF